MPRCGLVTARPLPSWCSQASEAQEQASLKVPEHETGQREDLVQDLGEHVGRAQMSVGWVS